MFQDVFTNLDSTTGPLIIRLDPDFWFLAPARERWPDLGISTINPPQGWSLVAVPDPGQPGDAVSWRAWVFPTTRLPGITCEEASEREQGRPEPGLNPGQVACRDFGSHGERFWRIGSQSWGRWLDSPYTEHGWRTSRLGEVLDRQNNAWPVSDEEIEEVMAWVDGLQKEEDHDDLDLLLNRLLKEPGNSPTEEGLIDAVNVLLGRIRALEAHIGYPEDPEDG